MTPALAGAVELLDRSLAYTRVSLAGVRPEHDTLRTPCHGWPLCRLLAHMDDGLDAYTQAATGRVDLAPAGDAPLLEAIRDKACALLGWWVEQPTGPVRIGDRRLPGSLLVSAAALEIAVHGYDVRVALGEPAELPGELAVPLLPVASRLAGTGGLPDCLGPPRAPTSGHPGSRRLLALLGRT